MNTLHKQIKRQYLTSQNARPAIYLYAAVLVFAHNIQTTRDYEFEPDTLPLYIIANVYGPIGGGEPFGMGIHLHFQNK